MEVTLTIVDSAGGQGTVTATGTDYTDALTKAHALVPENCRAITIRTDQY
ncbi:hypothetical protein [Paenarthrobacter sp. YJN-5]|nr:hypothetical protein [Paenarthrobacter sp. YJN-5]QOT16465.1 hypothetical protein HMI59_07515 [Paenarthrobacter sp. YJN-5]